jgi:hypothetical protein
MGDNQQSGHDPLEEAIRAFQGMTVGERPADAEMLARFGIRQDNVSGRSGISLPSKRKYFLHLVIASTAAAVLLFGGVVFFLRNSPSQEPAQVAAADSSGKGQGVSDRPYLSGRRLLREGLGSFGQQVAAAQVIVLATAVGSAPAPAKKPRDLPETLLRFRVKRVLKGKLAGKVITTRTPTAADEFLGKDWIILLSPDYVAGKHQYASHVKVKLEKTVKAVLSRDKK